MIATASWICQPFAALAPWDVHDMLRARQDVFVLEQTCLFPEIDGRDPHCHHLLGRTARPLDRTVDTVSAPGAAASGGPDQDPAIEAATGGPSQDNIHDPTNSPAKTPLPPAGQAPDRAGGTASTSGPVAGTAQSTTPMADTPLASTASTGAPSASSPLARAPATGEPMCPGRPTISAPMAGAEPGAAPGAGTDGMGAPGTLLAYARIVPPGVIYAEPSIGRILTTAAARGCGLGHALMAEALMQCTALYPGRAIRIGAQQHLQAFYRQSGFITASAAYDEDGIAHVEMLRPASPA
ncbi:GNAT family N-acetyltransferase [Rhodothalassium salexigens]|uniref:GNAT family N-acetyltransferase n=1 Tax=Rhodothalassium salexigens TaxID=1086 RepID=UPI001912C2D1|nr:GNAT family N-acetyltransferase [Rhodothalassium salexigens]